MESENTLLCIFLILTKKKWLTKVIILLVIIPHLSRCKCLIHPKEQIHKSHSFENQINSISWCLSTMI